MHLHPVGLSVVQLQIGWPSTSDCGSIGQHSIMIYISLIDRFVSLPTLILPLTRSTLIRLKAIVVRQVWLLPVLIFGSDVLPPESQ